MEGPAHTTHSQKKTLETFIGKFHTLVTQKKVSSFPPLKKKKNLITNLLHYLFSQQNRPKSLTALASQNRSTTGDCFGEPLFNCPTSILSHWNVIEIVSSFQKQNQSIRKTSCVYICLDLSSAALQLLLAKLSQLQSKLVFLYYSFC